MISYEPFPEEKGRYLTIVVTDMPNKASQWQITLRTTLLAQAEFGP